MTNDLLHEPRIGQRRARSPHEIAVLVAAKTHGWRSEATRHRFRTFLSQWECERVQLCSQAANFFGRHIGLAVGDSRLEQLPPRARC